MREMDEAPIGWVVVEYHEDWPTVGGRAWPAISRLFVHRFRAEAQVTEWRRLYGDAGGKRTYTIEPVGGTPGQCCVTEGAACTPEDPCVCCASRSAARTLGWNENARHSARQELFLSELTVLREERVDTKGPWSGVWNNWIAPYHACPRCGKSLNWVQGEDVFDKPMISTKCCGVIHQAKLLWPHESTVAADRCARTAEAEK